MKMNRKQITNDTIIFNQTLINNFNLNTLINLKQNFFNLDLPTQQYIKLIFKKYVHLLNAYEILSENNLILNNLVFDNYHLNNASLKQINLAIQSYFKNVWYVDLSINYNALIDENNLLTTNKSKLLNSLINSFELNTNLEELKIICHYLDKNLFSNLIFSSKYNSNENTKYHLIDIQLLNEELNNYLSHVKIKCHAKNLTKILNSINQISSLIVLNDLNRRNRYFIKITNDNEVFYTNLFLKDLLINFKTYFNLQRVNEIKEICSFLF